MDTIDLDVKAIRTARGLTQQGLADAIGVNLSTVWRWENGQAPKGAARAFLIRMKNDAPAPEQAA